MKEKFSYMALSLSVSYLLSWPTYCVFTILNPFESSHYYSKSTFTIWISFLPFAFLPFSLYHEALNTSYGITSKRVLVQISSFFIDKKKSYSIVNTNCIRIIEHADGSGSIYFAKRHRTVKDDNNHVRIISEDVGITGLKEVSFVEHILRSSAFNHEAPLSELRDEIPLFIRSRLPSALVDQVYQQLQSRGETIVWMGLSNVKPVLHLIPYPMIFFFAGIFMFACLPVYWLFIPLLSHPILIPLLFLVPLFVSLFIFGEFHLRRSARRALEQRFAYLVSDRRLYKIAVAAADADGPCTALDPIDADVIETEEHSDRSGSITLYRSDSPLHVPRPGPGAQLAVRGADSPGDTEPAFLDVRDVLLAHRAVRSALAARLAARV